MYSLYIHYVVTIFDNKIKMWQQSDKILNSLFSEKYIYIYINLTDKTWVLWLHVSMVDVGVSKIFSTSFFLFSVKKNEFA